jgi:hypothetical protein
MTQRWINPQCDTVASFEPVDDFVNGSYLLGKVRASYDQLVELFGEPNGCGDDKVHNSWDTEFQIYTKTGEVEDTVYANLYDWKEVNAEFAKGGEYYWHIGGVDKRAVDLVYDLLRKSFNPEYRFFRKGVE